MDTILFILFILLGVAGSLIAGKLTVWAALAGGIIGTVIYIGVGWLGVVLMAAFFLMGTMATSWKKNFKIRLGLMNENEGPRTTGQVLANGGAAGLLGLLAFFFPQYTSLYILMIAGVFSSATADTVSSELGSVYGSQFYDILSFKKGQRGMDGVISIEGLLFGMAGSGVIATIYGIAEGADMAILWIVVAGTIGNLADSYLGALLERRGVIGNDLVNFINTIAGAMVILLFCL